ncbi:MAG: protein kinase [Acidobacteriota bacterium]
MTPQQRVGPYQLRRCLGSGGMGEVWEAWDERLERWVAVKLVRADRVDSESSRRRFLREAKTAAALNHPAIVQIHDIVEHEGLDAIVMELVEGMTLSARLESGPLRESEVVPMARRITSALATAHRRGVVHRDLKAENVMVTPEGAVKILDFGIAKRLGGADHESLSADGQVLGTLRTMSPEQIRGFDVDPRSDFFSLGVLLYELVTGITPFRGISPVDTASRICSRRQIPARRLVPSLSPGFSGLIDALLEKEREHRPRDCAEVLSKLDALGPGAPAAGSADVPSGPLPDPSTLERSTLDPETLDSGGSASPRRGPLADPDLVTPATVTPSFDPSQAETLGPPGRYLPAGEGSLEGEGPVGTAPTSPAQPLSGGFVVLGRRRWMGAAAVLAVALGISVTWWLGARKGPGEETLRVAVPKPTVEGAATDPLLGTAVRLAMVRSLVEMSGAAPLALEEVDAFESPPQRLALALAADEVLTVRLDCTAISCRGYLERVREGTTVATEGFEASTDRLLAVSRAVEDRTRRLYADVAGGGGGRDSILTAEAYEAYLEVQRDVYERRGDRRLLLERVTELRAAAPSFLDLYLLEARIARSLFLESRSEEDLERVTLLLDAARRLAPESVHPVFFQAQVAIDAGQLDRGAALISSIEALDPGDTAALYLRARLADLQGQPEEALRSMRAAVARRPAVPARVDLARMAYRQGRLQEARGELAAVLRLVPDFHAALSLLAELEMLTGDPERAVEIYERLAARSPGVASWGNLGLAHFLAERYDRAAEQFRRALELAPNHPGLILNLADAQWMQGDRPGAEALYRRVVERTETGDLGSVGPLSIRAQALAHLGRSRQAVATVQRALRQAPDNPNVAVEAALVYALVGDRVSTLANVERALDLGAEPRWFQLPWFAWLHDDPELIELTSGG